jgi:hypothetical protein
LVGSSNFFFFLKKKSFNGVGIFLLLKCFTNIR